MDEEELNNSIMMLKAEFKKLGSSGVYEEGSNVSLTYEKVKEYVSSYFDKLTDKRVDTKISSLSGKKETR